MIVVSSLPSILVEAATISLKFSLGLFCFHDRSLLHLPPLLHLIARNQKHIKLSKSIVNELGEQYEEVFNDVKLQKQLEQLFVGFVYVALDNIKDDFLFLRSQQVNTFRGITLKGATKICKAYVGQFMRQE
ncbi:hypothetical protein L1987_20860 [Smallanthus sonchifolius]|uniref:Uncharacterized protein n=1 Tax=Smallanthus sonchifolius TaxID=185202 RepID=A0ACB9IUG3_9ASTR|nr:hypothetical protein L1987_20860 [Smallanthus sonchifolius]